MNTLKLRQYKGGTVIKQADHSSEFSYILVDTQGTPIPLEDNMAQVTLRNKKAEEYWETTAQVTDSKVDFTLPGNLPTGDYILEIICNGYVFPSDNSVIIRIVEGFEQFDNGEVAELISTNVPKLIGEAVEEAVENFDYERLKGDKGEKGEQGKPLGIASHELLEDNQTKIVFDDEKGTTLLIPPGKDGYTPIKGKDYDDGYTPQKGKDYFDGEDGISPIITTEAQEDKLVLKILDKEGEKKADILYGKDGYTPQKGVDYFDGEDGYTPKKDVDYFDGKDGVSPTIETENQVDGYLVTLTDKEGEHSFKLLHGKDAKVDVVDDLTTGGSDKALSAEQGKKLFKTIVKYHPDAVPPKVMTAVIDQANSNPLTCITYEDDAKMMEKGSPEWDDFFQSQLVLFKDGKEVRELEDSELSGLSPSDGDVMVRFPRKGLRIKTVGEKVYVSMTNKADDPDFKYYAHTRGNQRKDNFYLGAYLGYEESGKLRSITGKAPTGNKTIGSFRTIAQANGTGYEQLAFYQWTFLQAMYVLKYGNLDSQTALGKGNTSGSNYNKATGETNGKGIDFGSTSDTTKVRFQWIEDFYGTKLQWCDGWKSGGSSNALTATDNFNNDGTDYSSYDIGFSGNIYNYVKKVQGTSELGFLIKLNNGSASTYYCDYQNVYGDNQKVASVGGNAGSGATAGAFYFYADNSASDSFPIIGARLMFL